MVDGPVLVVSLVVLKAADSGSRLTVTVSHVQHLLRTVLLTDHPTVNLKPLVRLVRIVLVDHQLVTWQRRLHE